jgi:chemotaxis protein methyltransferase CheR
MNASLSLVHAERFRRVVADCMGLHFDDAKQPFLAEVLHRRLKVTRCDAEAYLASLSPTSDELGPLAEELTVPETYFFRNHEQFRALTAVVLPGRLSVAPARQLRILSAGCASGEEAYSLAIAVREAGIDQSCDVSILGVDINPVVLRKAAQARFSPWALRDTPPGVQQRWFRSDGRDFALDESLRKLVRFEECNLALADPARWHPHIYDVIFVRNVLMYFTPDRGAALVARIAGSLKPGGYLFLGHAETLRGMSNDFHLKHTHGAFYYQRRDHREDPPPQTSALSVGHSMPAIVEAVDNSETWVDAVRRAAERIAALADPLRVTAPAAGRAWDLSAAVALLRQERFGDALEAVRRFPPESGRDPDVLLLHAALLTHRGQLAEAEMSCRHLLEVDGLNAGAHYLLALCREGAGDRAGAVHHDQVAIYLDPAFAMPHLHLGLLAKRERDQPLARNVLEHALLLLQREDASRVLLFGGGFSRNTLVDICRAELVSCGGRA